MQTLKSFIFTWVYNVVNVTVTAKSIQDWKITKITLDVFRSVKALEAFKYSWIEIN